MARNVKSKLFPPVRAFRDFPATLSKQCRGSLKSPYNFYMPVHALARLSLSEKPLADVTVKTAHSDPVSHIKILSVGPAPTYLN